MPALVTNHLCKNEMDVQQPANGILQLDHSIQREFCFQHKMILKYDGI